jgi:hypothetical protein
MAPLQTSKKSPNQNRGLLVSMGVISTMKFLVCLLDLRSIVRLKLAIFLPLHDLCINLVALVPPLNPFDFKHPLYHPKLERLTADVFMWKDFRQCHHQCRHMGNNVPNDAEVDASCALLLFLDGIYFCPRLHAVLCPTHLCLVPGKDLELHLSSFHSKPLRRCGVGISEILDHVKRFLGIATSQTVTSLFEELSSVVLSSPIPGLRPPEPCVQCTNCKKWYVTGNEGIVRTIRRHWMQGPSCSARLQEQEVISNPLQAPYAYATRAFYGHSTYWPYRIRFIDNYQPAESLNHNSSVTNSPAASTNILSECLVTIGWVSFIKRLGTSRSTLLQLVALPFKHMADAWPANTEGRQIELGLQVLYSFLRVYLSDANYLVNTYDGSVRAAISIS